MSKLWTVVLGVLLFSSSVRSNSIFRNPWRAKHKSPVIFVPGDGGSQVEAKLNKPNHVHVFCSQKTKDFFNIWLNIELLVPLIIDCWIDNVRLYYDNNTRTTHNSPGVEIRIPGWGDPEVVEWIDPSHNKAGAYFKDIAKVLYSRGYERNRSVRGAPYDFRKAPNENKLWFSDMQKLVEDTFDQNNETKVTIISHSMGSPMTLFFLQGQTATWKEKYIQRVISIAGAWAGSAKALKVFAMGDDLDSFALSASVMRDQQISSPSLAWLLPNPLFWKPSDVLVQTPKTNYTIHHLEKFFNDIDYRTGWEMRQDNIRYSLDFKSPDVELHCLYGSGMPTVERLLYKKESISGEKPSLVYGDGDGTVNTRSLEACKYWAGKQKASVTSVEVKGSEHMSILADERTISYIDNLMKEEY